MGKPAGSTQQTVPREHSDIGRFAWHRRVICTFSVPDFGPMWKQWRRQEHSVSFSRARSSLSNQLDYSELHVPTKIQRQRASTLHVSRFFISDPGVESFSGVSVSWSYRHHDSVDPVRFIKSPRRWGRYNSRPEREVVFSPISRLLPAHEIAGLRDASAHQLMDLTVSQLSTDGVNHLSYVMGRNYSLAEIHEFKRHHFSTCSI